MLREIHTIHGSSRLGYLWVLINNIVMLTFLWKIREILGFRPPHGMPVPTFLISGYAVWGIVSGITNRSISAVNGNRALLTFPQVTPLDVMLARVGVITATEVLVAAILLSVTVAAGYNQPSPDWGGVMGVILASATLGLGLGTLLGALNVLFPVVERLTPIVFRFLFFVSGVFFSLRSVPYRFRDLLGYNPILQLVEWSRLSLSPHYSAPDIDTNYLIAVCLPLLTLGALLERYMRSQIAGV
jgi:capsular polysaccharide transport system permease protein